MTRLVYLDNLRSVALLLGLVFHTAIVYGADIGYAIQNADRSSALGVFCYFIHSFRMPLFFCISGFFTGLVWEKKGAQIYWEGRWKRILVPTLFGILFLVPIQYFLMQLGSANSLGYLSFYLQFWNRAEFALSHLWFLVYLLIYSIFWVIVATLGKSSLPSLSRLNLSRLQFLLSCAFFTFVLTWVANQFLRKGNPWLGIEPLLLVFQGSFFFLGILSYYTKQIFVPRSVSNKEQSLFAFLLLPSFLAFLVLERVDPFWKAYQWVDPIVRTIHLLLWTGLPWLWIPFFVGIFQKAVSKGGEIAEYLSRASLAVYLIHHPISLVIAYYSVSWETNVMAKFFCHLFLLVFLSFSVYEFGIKRVYLFRLLTGTKEL